MKLFLPPLILVLAASVHAEIETLDLPLMVGRADEAVFAEVLSRRTLTTTDERHGTLHFTALLLEGRSLTDGTQVLVEVVHGGSLDPETGEGVVDSEAPRPDEVRTGSKVVAFYKWVSDLGDGRGANRLYAGHGGVYRTAAAAGDVVVLGRGAGYAVSANERLSELEGRIRSLAVAKQEAGR